MLRCFQKLRFENQKTALKNNDFITRFYSSRTINSKLSNKNRYTLVPKNDEHESIRPRTHRLKTVVAGQRSVALVTRNDFSVARFSSNYRTVTRTDSLQQLLVTRPLLNSTA